MEAIDPELVVRPATSFLPDEKVKPWPYDLAEAQALATTTQGFGDRIPDAAAQSASRILHGSGLASNIDVMGIEILTIGRAYRAVYIPLTTHKPAAFGHKPGERTKKLWYYVFCQVCTT